MNPAKNNLPTDSPTINAYRTKPMLGGIRMTKVPQAASEPMTSL